jgi:predicted trehalose synthase
VSAASALPTAEELAAARWFGGKAAAISTIELEDRLELGDGAAISILLVDGAHRYVWTEGPVASAIVGSDPASDRVSGSWRFRHVGARHAPEAERPIGIDQSNTSYVVGERIVVKLFRRLWPGTHPEIEIVEYLSDKVDSVPAFAGAVEWRGHGVALLQEYVPAGRDGWTWCGDAVMAGDVGRIGRIGAISAELHAALAGMGETSAGPDVLRAWHQAADAQLARVLDIVPSDVAEELGRAHSRIRAELAALEKPAKPPALQRVHGDFHIGQILAAGDRLVVLDFEGEPTRPVADRAAPGTALRDVAAMLRSFDHLGRHVEHERWPGHRADIERWIDAARAAFLEAYGPVDRRLLRALEFEKACYEFVYAAEFEPSWVYAPRAGMRWLLEHADG